MKAIAISVLAVAGLAVSASAQQLPVLLIVDNSDPSNVVFTSTGNAAAVNDSSVSIVGGVSLLGLFAGGGFNTNGSQVVGGDLSPSGNPGAYDTILNDLGTLGTSGLNLWAVGVDGPQSFNTNDPAFTGSTSGFDFGGVAFNASGDIIVGDTAGVPGSGAILGQWQLIPTPGAVALFGIAGLAATRRRRA